MCVAEAVREDLKTAPLLARMMRWAILRDPGAASRVDGIFGRKLTAVQRDSSSAIVVNSYNFRPKIPSSRLAAPGAPRMEMNLLADHNITVQVPQQFELPVSDWRQRVSHFHSPTSRTYRDIFQFEKSDGPFHFALFFPVLSPHPQFVEMER